MTTKEKAIVAALGTFSIALSAGLGWLCWEKTGGWAGAMLGVGYYLGAFAAYRAGLTTPPPTDPKSGKMG